jgi:adenine-specific DNA-methyltransferase
LNHPIDFRHPYLTSQLIAYIGNKRALLRFLYDVFCEVARKAEGGKTGALAFLDPFAGSGAVSRLARMMGFSVAANDWEPYSNVINSCHVVLSPGEVNSLFRSLGGLERILEELNSLPSPSEDSCYIARHYAPRRTESADWATERLFYTTENALRIDAIRQRIEEMYPGEPTDPAARKRKTALVAPLLYEAATHTNTSGVFKACHRGFGGHGRDALTRIMAPIRLEPPVLVEAAAPSTVACEDALEFLKGKEADICYLDPPYATHQYGSNYFMLNSIALWDRLPVSQARGADGRLLEKAGIRGDWTKTRSAFCYPSSALPALRQVVQAVDCRHLVISYSDEGLISLEELCDLLSETGDLSVHVTGYVKYPGGKQSLGRRTSNIELALVVDRHHGPARSRTSETFREVTTARLMGRAFNPERIRQSFFTEPGGIILDPAGARLRLAMRHHWRFAPEARAPSFSSGFEADRFIELLSFCEVPDVKEEIEVLVHATGAEHDGAEKKRLLREILRLFNKLAHRKYAREFASTLEVLQRLAEDLEEPEGFRAGLARVVETAARRNR